MSTRSSARRLLSPFEDPDKLLSRKSRSEPLLLFDLEEDDMAGQASPQGPIPDLRSMEELLQAPTDGVGDILANQFELKIGLLNLVTAIAFYGFENDDPHSHIQQFIKITQTVKLNNVLSDVVKLLLFLFSLEGAARTWLEKEPPNSITTWNNLVSKFVNRFFPPSKTINPQNEITRYQQRLAHMPKFAKMVKDLLTNKEKLLELANTPLNENCSAVLLKKLPEKLRDTERFLIPCDFYGLESCMALADLVNYDVNPRVPLILGRPFLRMAHALVDVYGEELTLRLGDEKLVFNVESTSKYAQKHGDESIHKIDVLDITCKDHFYEEIDTFLASHESISSNIDDGAFDMEGDIRVIETLLNNDISNDLPPLLIVFEINETKKIKTSIEDPPDLELKDLPPHLGYAFLKGTSKLPIIIAKYLKREEKEQLLKRWVNPKIHEVIKAEVIKLLDAGLIYPISDSPWMLKHLAGNEFYCFLNGFSGYFQIPIDPQDKEKTTFTCLYGTFAYRRMPFGLCNVPGTFQRYSTAGTDLDSTVGTDLDTTARTDLDSTAGTDLDTTAGTDQDSTVGTDLDSTAGTDLDSTAGTDLDTTAETDLDISVVTDLVSLVVTDLEHPTGSESRPPMLNKENYVPWSFRLLRYAKSRPNGKLIHNSILNGPYVRRMIPEPGDVNRDVNVTETFHLQTDDELSDKELKKIEADDQAIQTILLGLPEDIYAAVDSCETAQKIWLRVQQMIKGSDIGIQEKKAKLVNEWESRHVTIVHQTKDLHTADHTQLYDFLKYNQKEVDELKAERLAKTQDPLALMAKSNNPYVFLTPYQDQSSFNQNHLQQPMPNPEDITDPTTTINMALALMAKAFKLNYSTPTNNNQRISSNPRNMQIAQPANLDEIEKVNTNCILMASLQQASTSGTQTDSAPVYDTD
nr:reverse transcriptase domain-containing protein [Tanacetum cinerariifolium]